LGHIRHIMHSMHRFTMHSACIRLKQRFQQDRGRSAAPEAARTILSGSGQVKNRYLSVKLLKLKLNRLVVGGPEKRL
jgi:hypothetical protein